MIEKYFRLMRHRMAIEDFERLPRNPAYKYEYLDGEGWLTPRPHFFHAILDLVPPGHGEPFGLRPLPPGEILDLVPLFRAAFRRVQPFASLSDQEAEQAGRESLENTLRGSDGPLVEPACFCAYEEGSQRPAGAILITLLPALEAGQWRYRPWPEPPPSDAVDRRLGQPHLTWVFVSPMAARRGLATALLAAGVEALLELGYPRLASTFLLGNDRSLLWHWRNGFRLLPSQAPSREPARRNERPQERSRKERQ